MAAKAQIEIILSNGEKAGKTLNELTAQSVKFNREIKKMEIGTEEYIRATEDLAKVNSKLKQTKKEISEVEQAQTDLNSVMSEYLPFSNQLSRFVKGFKDIKTATDAASFATNLFGKALIATGIGAIVVALGLLFTWLTKTQAGMDFVAKSTAAVSNIFQVIIGRAFDMAKALGEIFSGNFAKGFEGLSNSVSGLGKELTSAAKSGWENTAALQAITREEKKLEMQRASSRAEVERLKKLSEDSTKSESVRLKAAQDAYGLEQNLLKSTIDLQTRKIAAIKEQNEVARKAGLLTDEMANVEYDAQIRLDELREESFGKQTELQNKANELNRSANEGERQAMETMAAAKEAKRQKELEDQAKYNEMVAKADQDLIDLRISMMNVDSERKMAQLEIQAQRDIEAFKGTEEQKAQYKILREQQLATDLEAVRKTALEKELAGEIESEEIRRSQIEENFYNYIITEQERDQMLYELKRQGLMDRLDLIKSIHGEESIEYQTQFNEIAKLEFDQNQKRLNEAKKFSDAKNQLEKQGLQTFNNVVNGTLQLLGKEEEGRKKNIGIIKAFKAAQVKASFIAELAAIWETSNANPGNILFPGAGNILAVAKTAAATIRFGAGLRDIASLKYALGGRVEGPSHAMGGIPFAVKGSPVRHEMEGGEIIMTKGVGQNPQLAAAASMINQMGGGRAFAEGGRVGMNSTPSASTVVNNLAGPDRSQEVIQELQALRNEMSTWQRELRVKMSLQDLRKAEDVLKAVEMDTMV